MWKKLWLASLFAAVAGLPALTAAGPVPRSEPRRPGRDFPLYMTCTGVLGYSTAHTSGGAVRVWSLQEGDGNRTLRLPTSELKKKAEKLLGKKVKVKMTTYELADEVGGHVVLEIDPAGGTGAFPADAKPALTFTQDGKAPIQCPSGESRQSSRARAARCAPGHPEAGWILIEVAPVPSQVWFLLGR